MHGTLYAMFLCTAVGFTLRYKRVKQMRSKAVETTEISTRAEFAQWAIQRAQEIMTNEGAAFAIAARDMNEDGLANSATQLGQAIADAMLEVFDGLLAE